MSFSLVLCGAGGRQVKLFNTDNNNNGNFCSALPIKNVIAQGAYKSDTSNNIITQTHTHTHTHARTHTHAHTHTHSHTSSFKNYMPPKYTFQKAENQTTGASFALSPSLSLSPHSPMHRCRSQAVPQEERQGEQLNTQRSSKSLVRTLSGIVWVLVEF